MRGPQHGQCALVVTVPHHPQFRPGVKGRQFAHGTLGVLVARGHLDTGRLDNAAGIANDHGVLVAEDQFHAELAAALKPA